MKRIVSIWLPAWPIERLRRALPAGPPRDQLAAVPFALVTQAAGVTRITAVNARARSGGVHPGLALADARAVLPALVTRPAEAARDAAALLALARWAGRYGPQRHVDGADGLWIDTTGVAHLFAGEARLAGDIYRRLSELGLTARVAMASTPGAAHALARFATRASRPVSIVPNEALAATLASLPLAALRLDDETVQLARRLGLRRIGDLYGLPRTSVARRFRSEAKAAALLARLDAALGSVPEPRAGLAPPPELSVAKSFPEPLVATRGLATAVAELTHEIAAVLDAQGLGLRRGRLWLGRTDGSAAEVRVGTAAAVNEAAHLLALLAGKLEMIDAGFGIDTLRFEAFAVEPLAARQQLLPSSPGALAGGHGGPGERDTAAARLCDRLASRLGSASVVSLALASSHIPEHAERRRPVLGMARAPVGADDCAFCASHLPAHRPPLLLAHPEEITVMAAVPDGPPMRFAWRRVEHRVVRAAGPERIEAEWWRWLAARRPLTASESEPPADDPAMAALGERIALSLAPRLRDYYRVEDQSGGCYWLFRDGLYGRGDEGEPPRWFLHGLFA